MIYFAISIIILMVYIELRQPMVRKFIKMAIDEIFQYEDYKTKWLHFNENWKYKSLPMIFDIRKWTYEDFFGDMDKW